MAPVFALALHGGAGTILKTQMSPALEAAYHLGLKQSLDAGYGVLEQGGSSLDAVEATILSLENCALFNAGLGSVFNSAGAHQMDAALMEGASKRAGAVGAVVGVKNPIRLARAVMEQSSSVMLVGSGAEDFGRRVGLEFKEPSYFYSQERYAQWLEAKAENTISLDHSAKKMGTVGAVALDIHGNLAAGTSTGGMTNKAVGRIGDSPIIGAGTYADNATCAVSCTGHGELFMRAVVGHDIACLMAYKGLSLAEACDTLVHDKLISLGGEGGLIALDARGNVAMPFNSEGMYRAYKHSGGASDIKIYKE